MMKMHDIGEFAKQAASRFLDAQKDAAEKLKLGLAPQAVENLIRSAFYASMIMDEGRSPRSTLMCYREGAQSDVHILFEIPSEVSATEIAMLSHAVADDCHICCISKKGILTICGLHLTRLNDRRDLGYASFRVANPLKVSIIGPGHIEMSTGGIALVYKAGDVSEEALLLRSPIMGKLASCVQKEMQPIAKGTVEVIEHIFNDLAKAIVRLGHGGLLLFAGAHKRSSFSSFRAVNSSPLLRDPLYEYWKSVADLLQSVGGKAGLPASPAEAKSNHSLIVAANTEMLEKCITAVAHLSGMDGAIALDFECKLVAFNAIIARTEVQRVNFRFFDCDGTHLGAYEDITTNRGSRYQAALSFVMKAGNSFAFVISQDGSVSAFHNQGGNVIVCDRGLRVME
jgi:hypothetical protein